MLALTGGEPQHGPVPDTSQNVCSPEWDVFFQFISYNELPFKNFSWKQKSGPRHHRLIHWRAYNCQHPRHLSWFPFSVFSAPLPVLSVHTSCVRLRLAAPRGAVCCPRLITAGYMLLYIVHHYVPDTLLNVVQKWPYSIFITTLWHSRYFISILQVQTGPKRLSNPPKVIQLTVLKEQISNLGIHLTPKSNNILRCCLVAKSCLTLLRPHGL